MMLKSWLGLVSSLILHLPHCRGVAVTWGRAPIRHRSPSDSKSKPGNYQKLEVFSVWSKQLQLLKCFFFALIWLITRVSLVELQSLLETTTAELEENLKSLQKKTSFQGGGGREGEGKGAPVLRMPPVIVPVSLVYIYAWNNKPHPCHTHSWNQLHVCWGGSDCIGV